MIDRVSVVIADVDGTITVKTDRPAACTLEALERLHERGILFGTASGRPLDHRSLDKAREWGLSFEFDLAIGMNGGDLWDRFHRSVEHIMLLDAARVREILEFMWPLDCNLIVYADAYDDVLVKRHDHKLEESLRRNHSFVRVASLDEMSAEDTGKIEVQYEPELEDQIMAVVNAHPSPYWESVKTFPGTVEFMTPGLDKGVGLRRLAERLGIPTGEVMAFGDMDNDIAMIAAAGWGVCMANGCDEAKAAADDVTEFSVTDGGMGIYLDRHVLL